MNDRELIALALQEDVGAGDISVLSTVPPDKKGYAELLAKETGILCGCDLFKTTFEIVSDRTTVTFSATDGDLIQEGTIIAKISGYLGDILKAERTALNIIGHLSGIASRTNRIVTMLQGTNVKLLDTRKTLPLMRRWQKYAVKTGGGTNHRFGLYDMVMIKENHIRAAGGLEKAISSAVEVRQTQQGNWKIEVEVTNLDEFLRACRFPIDIIMLDNMKPEDIRQAVSQCPPGIKLEVSGGITEATIGSIAELGVDFISMGALTHSVKNFDYSLLFRELS